MAILDTYAYGTAGEKTATEAAARLRRYKRAPKDAGFGFVRFWPNMDARSARGLVNALNAIGVFTNPRADNVAYTGSFYGSALIAEGDPQRGTTVVQELAQDKAFSEIATQTAINCREKMQVYEITDIYDDNLATELSNWTSSTQGSRFSVQPRLNRDTGRWDVRITEHTVSAQNDPEFTSVNTGRVSQVTQKWRNQTSPAAIDTDRSVGNAVFSSVTSTDHCVYNYDRSVKTGVYQGIPEWLSVYSPTAPIVYVTPFHNATANQIPALLTGNGSLIYYINEFDLYDGERKHIYDRELDTFPAGWWNNSVGLTQTVPEFRWVPDSSVAYVFGAWKWRWKTITYDVKYFNSESLAYAEIDGGFAGSRVNRVGGEYRIWRSTKVTKIEFGTTWYDEGTALGEE